MSWDNGLLTGECESPVSNEMHRRRMSNADPDMVFATIKILGWRRRFDGD